MALVYNERFVEARYRGNNSDVGAEGTGWIAIAYKANGGKVMRSVTDDCGWC